MSVIEITMSQVTPTTPICRNECDPLSSRELEVLQFLAIGFNVPEIAPRLSIARSTVRSHIKKIYIKLGVHKRREALKKAREMNIL